MSLMIWQVVDGKQVVVVVLRVTLTMGETVVVPMTQLGFVVSLKIHVGAISSQFDT